MNGYTDAQMIVIRHMHAERRADAAMERLAAEWRRGQPARRQTKEGVRWVRRLAAPRSAATPAARQ